MNDNKSMKKKPGGFFTFTPLTPEITLLFGYAAGTHPFNQQTARFGFVTPGGA
jgi:hypothetical protein